jgi:phosphodiesterase/alkaline phosphatase D-like protein
MAEKKLNQIYNSNQNMGTSSKRHNHILNRIKQKLSHNAIIAQADKRIYQEDYNSKVHNFLIENDIKQTHKTPINKGTKTIRETLKQRSLIFNKNKIKFLTQKNPTPPKLNARIKIHKPNNPIRPVVNNITAPTYKIAKKLNDILKQCSQLKINTTHRTPKTSHVTFQHSK